MNVNKLTPAFTDDRGSIWDYLTGEEIHHVGFLQSKKNSIRGKHFHKEQKQFTLVTKGKVRIIAKNLLKENSEIEDVILSEMEIVLFPPFCYHELQMLEDSECLVFTSKSRVDDNYEKDTFRIKDIKTYKLEE